MLKNKEKLKSVRAKLFFTVCVVIALIILLLVLINSVVLEKFYIYSKVNTVKNTYEQIKNFYLQNIDENKEKEFNEQIKLTALKNNMEILIKTNEKVITIATNIDGLKAIDITEALKEIEENNENGRKLYYAENVVVEQIKEKKSDLKYLTLFAKLDNGYILCIRTPASVIEESVKVSNTVLLIIGGIAIIISGIIASIISKKFTKPILELNEIAEGMSNLDFSKKYRIKDAEDEINNLGKSINIMSDKLESTIKELKKYNSELEKDIEKKSKIDEMRKQFISDVSHELKTPISLIQGYAEGLIENVNTDEQSKKYYAEVILDESNKMDKLVKQLLELMKLENDVLVLNNKKIDLVALIKEVIRKHDIYIKENNIEIQFYYEQPVMVLADDFYIEQVISNYITNAIKYSKQVNGIKQIKITIEEKNDKIRVNVFNTGDCIKEEDINKIWERFYKVDTSRNRESGGTGIGLAYVKAVMNNYKNDYGVINKENGVEFYFECIK